MYIIKHLVSPTGICLGYTVEELGEGFALFAHQNMFALKGGKPIIHKLRMVISEELGLLIEACEEVGLFVCCNERA